MQECWINVYKWWNNYSGEWAIYVGTECFNSNYDAQMYIPSWGLTVAYRIHVRMK